MGYLFFGLLLATDLCNNFLEEMIFQGRLQQSRLIAYNHLVPTGSFTVDVNKVFWQVALYQEDRDMDAAIEYILQQAKIKEISLELRRLVNYLTIYPSNVTEIPAIFFKPIYHDYPKWSDERLVYTLNVIMDRLDTDLYAFLEKEYGYSHFVIKNLKLKQELANNSGYPLDEYNRRYLWDALIRAFIYEMNATYAKEMPSMFGQSFNINDDTIKKLVPLFNEYLELTASYLP